MRWNCTRRWLAAAPIRGRTGPRPTNPMITARTDVHLGGVARLAGRHLVVYVHGSRAGTMTVSRTGYTHLDRHGAPACRAEQAVRVRTGCGPLVAGGTFRRHHDDHAISAVGGRS